MKKIITTLSIHLLVVGAIFFYINRDVLIPEPRVASSVAAVTTVAVNEPVSQTAQVVEVVKKPTLETQPEGVDTKTENTLVIGQTVEGRDIVAHRFGDGERELVFVGGIHGGYDFETVLIAEELIQHLKNNPGAIPPQARVTVIPTLNVDGLYKDSEVAGRFNAREVDLNRNFDCDWQAEATWEGKAVSGGSSTFSEPESAAFKTYIETAKPDAVFVWYGGAGGVFASSCHNDVLPETTKLTTLFAKASGYRAYTDYNFYEVTGDMVNWLAKVNIPAISIVVPRSSETDWQKNWLGIEGVLETYREEY